jgi:hypothetical protein
MSEPTHENPRYVTLPLYVKSSPCANGETVEWRLLFNGKEVTSLFGDADEVAAVKRLLRQAANAR